MKKICINVVSESGLAPGQGVDTAFKEMVAGFRERADVKLLVNSHATADVVHIHTFGPKGFRALFFDKGYKVVSAHVVPASLVGSIKGARYWLPLATWYLKRFYNRADAVVAVSGTTRDILVNDMKIKKPVAIIEPTIDTRRYKVSGSEKKRLRQQFNYLDQDFIVVGNGQIQPRKRFDDFTNPPKGTLTEAEFCGAVVTIPFALITPLT